jgi:transposase
VAHRNAPLSELGRLRLARAIVDQGWPAARAAERFQVSRPTAHRWATRYQDQGPAGMVDRSSRPHHSPRRTPAPLVRRIVHLRWTQRLGPAQIASQVGLAPSTVHAVLVRCRISRLGALDRATGQPIRRYEHAQPGALVHIDIKKLGNIPAGGGHRFLGRPAGRPNRWADRSSGRISRHHDPLIGHGFIHAAVDDHSRLAYAEIHPDETRDTAAGFLGSSPRLVRRPRHYHPAGPDRQRRLLPQPPLARHLSAARHHPQADPTLPAPNQRQGRAVQPHPGRGLGLSAAVPQRSRPPGRLRALAALV